MTIENTTVVDLSEMHRIGPQPGGYDTALQSALTMHQRTLQQLIELYPDEVRLVEPVAIKSAHTPHGRFVEVTAKVRVPREAVAA